MKFTFFTLLLLLVCGTVSGQKGPVYDTTYASFDKLPGMSAFRYVDGVLLTENTDYNHNREVCIDYDCSHEISIYSDGNASIIVLERIRFKGIKSDSAVFTVLDTACLNLSGYTLSTLGWYRKDLPDAELVVLHTQQKA